MTIDEKLQVFESYILNQVQNTRKENLNSINHDILKISSLEILELQKYLDDKLNKQYAILIAEKNKQITAKKYNLRHKDIIFKEENIQYIIKKVEKKLRNFTKSNGYINYLISALAPIANSSTEIFITKEDKVHKDRLEDLFKIKITVDGNFIGGYKAMLPPNILLDRTFKGALQQEVGDLL